MIFERRLLTPTAVSGSSRSCGRTRGPSCCCCAAGGGGYVALLSAARNPEPMRRSTPSASARPGDDLCIALWISADRPFSPGWLCRLHRAAVLELLQRQMSARGAALERYRPIQLQPSELMKIMLVVALAAWFHRASWERMGNLLFLVPPAIAVLVPVGLILKQPNLGTALITAMIGTAVFWAAGMRWWKFAAGFAAAAVAARSPMSAARLPRPHHPFLDPESVPLGPDTTSSSPRSRWVRGLWVKGFLRAHRASELPAGEAEPTSSSPCPEESAGGRPDHARLRSCWWRSAPGGVPQPHQFGRLLRSAGTNYFPNVFVMWR